MKTLLQSRPRTLLTSAGYVLLALAATLLLVASTLAQGEDPALAPANLVAGITEDGIVLSWDAPVSDADSVNGYEIEARHLQPGEGILRKITGNTSSSRTRFMDRIATDSDLRYTYRVRALRAGVASPWSSYVTVNQGVSATAAAPEPEPTEVVPVEPVAPTEAVPGLEATLAAPVAPELPTPGSGPVEEEPVVAQPPVIVIEPEVELISLPQQQLETEPEPVVTEEEKAPPVVPTTAAPQPEPTTAGAVAPVNPPIVVQPEPEPTTAAPQPEPTTAGAVAPVNPPIVVQPEPEPTTAAPQPEPTTAGAVAPVNPPIVVQPEPEPTTAAPQPQPTASMPEPESTASA